MEYQIVIFEIAHEYYGVKIASVESIIKMQLITTLPNMPAGFEGITNLRGKILPVVNLRKRFDLAPAETNKDNRIVVVSINSSEVGMLVDSVSEVLTIQDADIGPTPSVVTTVDSTFIIGIAKLENRLVILLDLNEILSVQEKSNLQSVPTLI